MPALNVSGVHRLRRWFVGAAVAMAALPATAAADGISFTPSGSNQLAGVGTSVAGDFNADGDLDLLVTTTNWPNSALVMLLGAGDGTFTALSPIPLSLEYGPISLVSADFDHDGHLDIATSGNNHSDTVSIFLGDGTGLLTEAGGSPITVGASPEFVTTADVDADGNDDVIVADWGDGNAGTGDVIVLLGDGTGGFDTAPGSPIVPAIDFVGWVGIGDFDGDDAADIAAVGPKSPGPSGGWPGTVQMLLGDGTGQFQSGSGPLVTVGAWAGSGAVADLDHDGNLDLAIGNQDGHSASVLLGNGAGGFTDSNGSPFTVDGHPHRLQLADIDGDGELDIVTAGAGEGTVTVLLGDGAGDFTTPIGSTFTAAQNTSGLTVADFNGDGRPDLAVCNWPNSEVKVLLNTTPQATEPTQVDVVSDANPSVGGQAGHISATVSTVAAGGATPTGTLTFREGAVVLKVAPLDASGVATITLKPLASGTHTIVATYDGSSTMRTSASDPFVQEVTAAQTLTALTSDADPSVVGQSGYVTATVSTVAPGAGVATGNVTFKDGSTTLATINVGAGGKAKLTLASLAAGAHSITATYNGNTTKAPSTSSALAQTVQQASTQTTLVSDANPSVLSQTGYITATVAPLAPGVGTPTGSLTFREGSTVLKTANLSGGATRLSLKTLSAGTHVITAIYTGSASMLGSTSSSLSQVITP